MTEIEKLKIEIQRLSTLVEKIQEIIEHEASKAAHIASLEEIQKAKEAIDDRFDKRTRTALLFSGFIVTALGILGWLGLPLILQKYIDTSALDKINDAKQEATKALSEITYALNETKKNPLIVLLTDYGSKSAYMGALKGVIYGVNHYARIETITSEIDSFDVFEASWKLWRGSRSFPSGTIFVAITNKGGLSGNPVVVKTKNGHIYIGYDNGCFDLVVQKYGFEAENAIASKNLTPPEFRDMFGVNDVFGRTAAKISMGYPPDSVGPVIIRYEDKLPGVVHILDSEIIKGTAMDIDRFGNVTTNITREELFRKWNLKFGDSIYVSLNKRSMIFPLRRFYGDNVPEGGLVAIFHEELLQLAFYGKKLAPYYQVTRGSFIQVRPIQIR
jgi:S-adenosylmethionine hydrolase